MIYRVTFKDGRPPVNVEADKMECGKGCVEFYQRKDGHFSLVVSLTGALHADEIPEMTI